jgi:hypothetical protein
MPVAEVQRERTIPVFRRFLPKGGVNFEMALAGPSDLQAHRRRDDMLVRAVAVAEAVDTIAAHEIAVF